MPLRPLIPGLEPARSAAERFQNEVLRPVLKLQNDLLLAVFRHYLGKRKVLLTRMPKVQRLEQIAHAVQQDNRLRGLLFGMVIGMFTLDEWQRYVEMEAEINRRMTHLLTRRLQDQIEMLL